MCLGITDLENIFHTSGHQQWLVALFCAILCEFTFTKDCMWFDSSENTATFSKDFYEKI